ncbi:hypothetical protein GSI_13298 [Ganoderma sinense ZZ0214-1]|uniref:Uncharacterized protein n=1 Tax=Ganoderma sinense ZZ0214-1 TaxID=1077348 RepID=A0A2G8RVQ0_9APHY|nr:hypothetical protein GSI_13298 [Ganoderma sinense ZZ0214-1]
MRLLDLETGDFAEFSSPSTTPPYAILSHRWDKTEQTYQDIKEIQRVCEENRRPAPPPRARSWFPTRFSSPHNGVSDSLPPPPALPQSIWDSSVLSDKVRNACKVAREDGFRYLWIDSCCIDKTSSSELSESINSMFAWYRDAKVCYTFLVDVPTSSFASLNATGSAFRSSVWFTRGWTLQELIAPRQLVFLSKTWEPLGTKASLSALIKEITGIPTSVLARDSQDLSHRSLDQCSVAQRMSWAANRTTAKVEDEAYSLLGIFDIQMPLLYGEGRRAFRRLQEEILRRIPDQTIFAWGNVHPVCFSPQAANPSPGPIRNVFRAGPSSAASGSRTMFAESPGDFAGAGRIVTVRLHVFRELLAAFCDISPQEYTSTPHGIRTDFPLLPLSDSGCPISVLDKHRATDVYLAILACQQSDSPGQLLCCVCHLPRPDAFMSTLCRGYLTDASFRTLSPVNTAESYAVFRLSLPSSDGQGHGKPELNLRLHTVYLDHPKRAPPPLDLENHLGKDSVLEDVTFTLPTWCRGALHTRGYDAMLHQQPISESEEDRAQVHRLIVSPLPVPQTSKLEAGHSFQWNIVADFSCECDDDSILDTEIIRASVHIVGWGERVYDEPEGTSSRAPRTDVIKTATLEWIHQRRGPPGRMVNGIELWREGRKSVALLLGVEVASAYSYRIHVEFVDQDLNLR